MVERESGKIWLRQIPAGVHVVKKKKKEEKEMKKRVRIGKFSSAFPYLVFKIYKDPGLAPDPLYLQLPGQGKQGNTVPTAPVKEKKDRITHPSPELGREPSIRHQVPLGHWRQDPSNAPMSGSTVGQE